MNTGVLPPSVDTARKTLAGMIHSLASLDLVLHMSALNMPMRVPFISVACYTDLVHL